MNDCLSYVFRSFDCTFRDLTSAACTCKEWNALIQLPSSGQGLLEKFQIPHEDLHWMDAYRKWVVNARHICLIDVSGSMGNTDGLPLSRVSRGAQKAQLIVQHIFALGVKELVVGSVSNELVLFTMHTLDSSAWFFKTIDNVGYEIQFPSLWKEVSSIIGGAPVTHLHLISDLDFNENAFEGLNELNGCVRVHLHQIGHNKNGTQFLEREKGLKRKFEILEVSCEERPFKKSKK